MDTIYIILIGAGICIMLIALLSRQKGAGKHSGLPKQSSIDKAEIDKALQRVGKRFEEEYTLLARESEQTRLELMQEILALRNRIEELEQSVNAKQEQPSSEQTVQKTAPVVEEEPDVLALKERYRRVFELAKEGLTPDEIAKRLGAGRGEIDLIFMLAAKRERGQGHA
ncbi:DUF6115 domain-containing protein [Brevibacillus sp. TJ4]|uniref:DUF6115 domain-containing protein n=1 Tax=Brevibacillus sp. TJ4 TaxID=3234853 RepID=UPI0037CEDABC